MIKCRKCNKELNFIEKSIYYLCFKCTDKENEKEEKEAYLKVTNSKGATMLWNKTK